MCKIEIRALWRKSEKILMSSVWVLMNRISMPLPANIMNSPTSFKFPFLQRTLHDFWKWLDAVSPILYKGKLKQKRITCIHPSSLQWGSRWEHWGFVFIRHALAFGHPKTAGHHPDLCVWSSSSICLETASRSSQLQQVPPYLDPECFVPLWTLCGHCHLGLLQGISHMGNGDESLGHWAGGECQGFAQIIACPFCMADGCVPASGPTKQASSVRRPELCFLQCWWFVDPCFKR